MKISMRILEIYRSSIGNLRIKFEGIVDKFQENNINFVIKINYKNKLVKFVRNEFNITET